MMEIKFVSVTTSIFLLYAITASSLVYVSEWLSTAFRDTNGVLDAPLTLVLSLLVLLLSSIYYIPMGGVEKILGTRAFPPIIDKPLVNVPDLLINGLVLVVAGTAAAFAVRSLLRRNKS